MDLTAYCNHPELKPGIIIYFQDKTGKTRTETIIDRRGDEITVKNSLHKPTVVDVKKVIGYWEPNVKIIRQNMKLLKNEVVK